MKKIKFRGRDAITGNWAYGYYYPSKGNAIIRDEKDNECIVLQKSVGQYVGLKENAFEQTEKNREIYEGDIIEFIMGERLSVEWNDDTCQWQYSDGSPINSDERYATHKMIVGNIYETLTPRGIEK